MNKLTEEQKKELREIDMNQPKPTQEEIDSAFICLQPFFERSDEIYAQFLKLQAEGKLGEIKRDKK